MRALPDAIRLHVVDFCTARSVGLLAVASRSLQQLLIKDDLLWGNRLVVRWPREGPVLCSLRPRATARQLYRALSTKRDARTQIMRRPERVIELDDDGEYRQSTRLDAEDRANDNADRLAFILCVGPFAGLARWTRTTPYKIGLRWQPQPAESCFDMEVPDDVQTWTAGEIEERYGDQLAQTLHVIDMQTHKCVTIFSDGLPDTINVCTHSAFSGDFLAGDTTTYSDSWYSCRHNYMTPIDSLQVRELYNEGRLGSVDYSGIEHCNLDLHLMLRVASGKLRLHEGDVSFDHSEYPTASSPLALREYVVDTIEQTHDDSWRRVQNSDISNPASSERIFCFDGICYSTDDGVAFADNRRRVPGG